MNKIRILIIYIFISFLGLAEGSLAQKNPSCKCPEGQVYFYDSFNRISYCGNFPILVNSKVKYDGKIAKCHTRFYIYRTPYGPIKKSGYGYTQTVCKNDLGIPYYNEQSISDVKNPEIDKDSMALYIGKMKLESKKGQVFYIDINAYCPNGYGYIPVSNMCSSGDRPICK